MTPSSLCVSITSSLALEQYSRVLDVFRNLRRCARLPATSLEVRGTAELLHCSLELSVLVHESCFTSYHTFDSALPTTPSIEFLSSLVLRSGLDSHIDCIHSRKACSATFICQQHVRYLLYTIFETAGICWFFLFNAECHFPLLAPESLRKKAKTTSNTEQYMSTLIREHADV